MGNTLGFFAGAGMLALIAALISAFFRQMGKISKAVSRRLLRCGVLAVCAGLAYFASGTLIFQAFYGNLTSFAQAEIIFRGPYIQQMFYALMVPSWFSPLSGAFAWAGHLLGNVLFGEYIFAGIMLSWGTVFLGLTLMSAALERLWGVSAARDFSLLIVCLPGAVFLFLPGWPCLAFLLTAAAFFFLGRRIKPRALILPSVPFSWALAFCVCLNGAAVFCAVLGKIG